LKVILRENVENLGKTGDILDVADGYGRNYLLPRCLAVKASTRNVTELEHQKTLIKVGQEKKREEAQELAQRLAGVSCTIVRKAGEDDKLFGSVTARDIAEVVNGEGIPVERKWVQLEEPIKKLGVYSIPVQIHPEVVGQIKVWVVKE